MRRLFSSLLFVLGCAGCAHPGPATLGPYATASVVLISIDTLRADRLPAHGYRAGRTPALDALAREAIVFDGAYSHCPLTLPAHASLLTGFLPPRHGVRDNLGFTLAASHETLATRLKTAGFATGAAVSSYVLRSQTGIARGFDSYDDALTIHGSGEALDSVQRDGNVAVDSLIRFVDQHAARRFFAFLHLYEPHSPYTPPERFRDLGDRYDGEVAHADAIVGRLLDHLRAKRLLDNSIVVVTSDHGEGLGDHGEQEHGIFLYREALHVPLFVRLPRAARGGTRVTGSVAQVDVAPTLLELVGAAATGLDGQSLQSALATGVAGETRVYAETLYPRYHFGWSELYAVTEGRYRYIRAPRPELYDLERDPREKANLAGERAAAIASMNAWLERHARQEQVATPDDVASDVREKLQALGYVGIAATAAPPGDLPDPKDKIGAYESLRQAYASRAKGQLEAAVAQFRSVLSDNPRMFDAWEMLGQTLAGMGRTQEAIEALTQALEIAPERPEVHMTLAKVYAFSGRPERAVKHAELASAKNPGAGFEVLAQLLMDEGQSARAAEFARKSVASDADRMMSHFILGQVAHKAGRCEEAIVAYQAAERAKARRTQAILKNLHAELGDCLARLGREADAEREFQKEIEAIPSSREGRTRLAMLYRSQGKDAQARAVLEGLVAAEPAPTADTYWVVVGTFATIGDREAANVWAERARARFPADPRFR